MSSFTVSLSPAGSIKQPTFEPWANNLLLHWFLYTVSPPSFVVSLLIFAVYWIVPFLISAYHGTLLSVARANALLAALADGGAPAGLLNLARQFAAAQSIHQANGLGYLEDTTHFIFAVVISLGAAVGTQTLRHFDRTAAQLLRDSIPRTNEKRVVQIYNRYMRGAFQRRYILLAVVAAVSACLLFGYLWDLPRYSYWWGSGDYGFAGLVFAVIVGAMVYSVVWAAILLVYGSLMLARLVRLPIELQPFHRDGCNGFAPLGRQIIRLWLTALFGGAAIFVTLRFGYLGVERTPVVWVLATFGSLAIPAIAILPLVQSLRALRRAQYRNLERLGVWLNRNLSEVDSAVRKGEFAEANSLLDSLNKVKDLFELYKTTNIWPFNPKALALILTINFAQLLLTAKQLTELIPDKLY
jgi:hypothetical protein